jgi:hypothetical protein
LTLLTEAQREKLLANGRKPDQDYPPVCKITMIGTSFTCLLSEMDQDEDQVFGYFDHGFGYPELGYGSLTEMQEAAKDLCHPLVNDSQFEGRFPMSEYTRAGRAAQRIVEPQAKVVSMQHRPGA